MGMMKSFIFDWLEMYGFEWGYDWGNLPDISMMDGDCPPAEEYYGNTN